MSVHAIRFEPPRHGHSVPLELYAHAIDRMAVALRSVRRTVARRLAAEFKLLFGEADRVVVLRVEPIELGSVATPLRVGVPGELKLYPTLEARFWETADALITGAANGDDTALSITAAEGFASAGDLADKEGYGLSLAEMDRARRSSGKRAATWTPRVNVVARASALRRYADERRKHVATTTVHVIGEIVEVSFRPPGFRLDTRAHGRLKVFCSEEVMDRDVRPNGGKFVLAHCRATIDAEDEPRDLVAESISPLATTASLRADWKASHGTPEGAELWSGPEAEEYLRGLRGRGSG